MIDNFVLPNKLMQIELQKKTTNNNKTSIHLKTISIYKKYKSSLVPYKLIIKIIKK